MDTTEGIKPCHNKIKAVEEFPVPKNVKQIRRFLGLDNCYRTFIKDFAKIGQQLAKNSTNLSCQEAFDLLKRALVAAPK